MIDSFSRVALDGSADVNITVGGNAVGHGRVRRQYCPDHHDQGVGESAQDFVHFETTPTKLGVKVTITVPDLERVGIGRVR